MKKTATMFLTFALTLILLLSSCGDGEYVSSGDNSDLPSTADNSVISEPVSEESEISFIEYVSEEDDRLVTISEEKLVVSEIMEDVSGGIVLEEAPDEYIDEQDMRYIKSDTSDYYILEGYAATDSPYRNTIKEVIVPSEICGLPVYIIGEYALSQSASIEKITLPDTLKIIYGSAFFATVSLTEIAIPDSVLYIGDEAFRHCLNLEVINFPSSVVVIGNSVLRDTPKLESITVDNGNANYHSDNNCLVETATKKLVAGCMNSIIPDNGSVEIIGREAFRGCIGLKNFEFPDSIKKIYGTAFYGCEGLTSVELKASLEYMGTGVFSHCENLENVSMQNYRLTYIPQAMFAGCTSLKNMVIPISINEIHEIAFSSCTTLESVEFKSENVFIIGWGAFGGCKALKAIDLPEKLETIGHGVFSSCNSLSEIYIPASVTTMGERVFAHRQVNIDIYVEHESLPEGWEEEWDKTQGGDSENITVHWRAFG